VATRISGPHLPLSRDNKTLTETLALWQTGKKWVSDITYIRVGDQWNYLTHRSWDLATGKIVGWALSGGYGPSGNNRNESLVGLHCRTRAIANGFIFHSDKRGTVMASKLKNDQILFYYSIKKLTRLMSRKEICWDNAVAWRAFSKRLKHEWPV